MPERRFTIVKKQKGWLTTQMAFHGFSAEGVDLLQLNRLQNSKEFLRCTQGRDQAVIHPALSRTDRGNDAGDGQDRPAVRHCAVPHGIPRAARYPDIPRIKRSTGRTCGCSSAEHDGNANLFPHTTLNCIPNTGPSAAGARGAEAKWKRCAK